MALLGVQLAITMIMASFLQKLSPHFSPARWMLCHGLIRYLHPSDEELKTLAGVSGSGGGGSGSHKGGKRKGKDRRHDEDNGEVNQRQSFMVPKKLDITLDTAKVEPVDLTQLHFYAEFQWLVDFAFCTVFVYALTEIYTNYFPLNDESNLSLLWIFLVLAFTLKVLFSVTAIYFRGEESTGERALCVTAAFFFLLVAMGLLVVPERLLDFRLETALSMVMKNLTSLARTFGLETNIPTSSLGLRVQLAIFCGVVGTFFTFPGLRLAKMHHDSLKLCADRPFLRLLLHASFIGPLIVTLTWVKPVGRDYFTARIFPGMTSPLMSPDVFDTTRLFIIVTVILLRLALMSTYLQAYLNMAHERIEDVKKEAGKIDSLELQRVVARVFYYLAVVALQYVAPLLLCLNFTFLLKTLGEYSWTSFVSEECSEPDVHTEPIDFGPVNETSPLTFANLRLVFTPLFFRAVLGFTTWWICLVWFGTSCLGIIYHSYFVQ